MQSTLVTGVKRDINLLRSLEAGAGDVLTGFYISFDSNRADALRLLAAGAALRWFDHHFAGEAVAHSGLEASIDTSPDACSSLLASIRRSSSCRTWWWTCCWDWTSARRFASSPTM